MEVAEERPFEQLTIDTVGEVPCPALGIQGIGRSIQGRPMFTNEVLPRLLITSLTAAGEGNVFEMQCFELCATFGGSLEGFNE